MSFGNLPDIHLAADPARFRTLLLSWFDREGRSLPWRRDRTLYGTWISEMMLQQTSVAVVEPYWIRFLARFPDVQALAAAGEDEVLSLWSGLGYYGRARHLHQAAVKVVENMGGDLPSDRESWQALPGVGSYASGAIASIGLGERVPAIDANARRVLSRWLVDDPEICSGLKPARLERTGSDLVDPDRPGDWNEALMELGALVCSARVPRCGDCPVESLCRAGRAGTAAVIPRPASASAPIRVELGVLALLWQERVFLMPPESLPVARISKDIPLARKDVSGLHRGLWGLPSGPWLEMRDKAESGLTGRIWEKFLERDLVSQGFEIKSDPILLGSFSHAITRYRLTVRVFALRLGNNPRTGTGNHMGPGFVDPGELGPEVELADKDRGQSACFCLWPPAGTPVSNLVTKSMALVAKSSV